MAKVKNNFPYQITDYSLGLMTAQPPHDIPAGAAVRIQNYILDEEGKLSIIKGYTEMGSGLSGTNGIKSAFTFKKKDGTELSLITYSTFVDWYDSTNDRWQHLKTGMVTGLKWGFIESNTTTANRMFCGNGTDQFSYWNGATTNLTAVVTAGDTTINVADTTNFSATGTIIYNGTEIAYTGKTGTTFTVASAHASSGADDGVAEWLDNSTYASPTCPKGNIFVIFRDRLFVAGADNNLINYSKVSDHVDFSTSGVGGAGTINIVEGNGNITAMGVKDNRILVFKSNTIVPMVITQNSLTDETIDIKPLVVADDSGTDNFQAVMSADNSNLFFVSKSGGLKELDSVPENNLFKPLQLSETISNTLKDWNFGDGKLIFYKKQLFAAGKEDENSTFNDIIEYLTINNGKKFISTLKGFNVGAFFINNGKLRFCDSAKTMVYTMFDGYDFDGEPIEAIWRGKRENFSSPFKKKKGYYYAVCGEISANSSLKATVYYDGGNKLAKEYVIKGDGSSTTDGLYVLGSESSAYGELYYGEVQYGGYLVDGLREFKVFLPLPNDIPFYDIQIEYSSNAIGNRARILGEGISLRGKDEIPKGKKIPSSSV